MAVSGKEKGVERCDGLSDRCSAQDEQVLISSLSSFRSCETDICWFFVLCTHTQALLRTLDAPSFAAWAESAAIPGRQPASQSSQGEPESESSQGGAALEPSQEPAASPYEQYRHK